MITRRHLFTLAGCFSLYPALVSGRETQRHELLKYLHPQSDRAMAAMIRIGDVWLQTNPVDLTSLLRRLERDLRLHQQPVGSTEEFAERAARRISSDFDQDDTVDIRGWMLAATEVRICAFFSLCARGL